MSDELMCCCPPCLSDCGTSRCHFHGLRGLQARRMSRTMRSIPGREQRAGSWPCQPLALSSPSHKLAGWHMRTTRTHAPTHTCVRARVALCPRSVLRTSGQKHLQMHRCAWLTTQSLSVRKQRKNVATEEGTKKNKKTYDRSPNQVLKTTIETQTSDVAVPGKAKSP